MPERQWPDFKHYFCPKCRVRYHWSELQEAKSCPNCGYNVVEKWAKPTWDGFIKGISE